MGFGLIIWSWLACSTALTSGSTLESCQEQKVQQIETNVSKKVDKTGIASFYHEKFVRRQTANGEIFSNEEYTAASNFFKLGTYVKVTNTKNGKHVFVKINDRMGHPTRVIDLTERAARDLKFYNMGIVKVEIEVVPKNEGRRQILAQNGMDDGQETPTNVF